MPRVRRALWHHRPVIRLYRAPWSTNVQRVTMALAHKGLAHEDVVISYEDRSAVVAVSAQPLVPVLVVDGEVLTDSMTIDRDFLFGAFSAADCCAYPFLKYATGRDPADDELFPRILDRHQTTARRPRLAAWIDRIADMAPSAA